MDLDLVFLGTSGSVPTARRGLAGTLVRRGGERILVDCGEGTQRQLLRSTVGLVELPEVFLTHYHADHYLGLPGMLKTFALRGREVPLTVYGPPGLRELFSGLQRIFGRLTYRLDLVELRRRRHARPRRLPDSGLRGRARGRGQRVRVCRAAAARTVRRRDGARPRRPRGAAVRAVAGRRGRGASRTAPRSDPSRCSVRRGPGAGSSLAGDTAPAATVLEIAQQADLLVHEATFAEEERDRADETLHSTAAGAAALAKAAGVRMLALTHLSNRYFGPEIAREARAIFPETVVPRDFDIIDVPFQERGRPRLVKAGARPVREEAGPDGEHGAGGGSGRSHRGGGDPDDPAFGGDPVGASPGGRAAPGSTR